MTKEEYSILANEICSGNIYAQRFLVKAAELFRIWDDIWDQDKPIDPMKFDDIFSDLCFGFGGNPFFKENREVLEAQIFVAWNAWQASNHWEHDPDPMKRMYAFFVRDYCFELEHLVAFLCGGKDHAKRMNLIIREKALEQLKTQPKNF